MAEARKSCLSRGVVFVMRRYVAQLFLFVMLFLGTTSAMWEMAAGVSRGDAEFAEKVLGKELWGQDLEAWNLEKIATKALQVAGSPLDGNRFWETGGENWTNARDSFVKAGWYASSPALEATKTITEVGATFYIMGGAGALRGGAVSSGRGIVAAERGAVSLYDDATLAASRYANRATDVSKASFEKNLVNSGWVRSVSKDGKTIIFQKDGAKYVLRDGAKSTGGPTADYYKPGSQSIDLKIRLEAGGNP